MKASIFKLVIVAVASLSFVADSSVIFAAQSQQSPTTAETDEGLLFNWKNAPWPEVIDWFADQAGFIVDPATQYPEGTFSLKSDRPLSPVESIDEINHKLRLSNPPKTLLRNGNRLYLVNANEELPGALVETIDVSELNNRGKYEPLQVKFDISGLDLGSVEEEVHQRINSHNERFFQLFPSTNEMFVRESGENLRFIRDIVKGSKANKTPTYAVKNFKYISAELFVDKLGGFLRLNDDNRTDDGSLIVQIDSTPGSQRLLIRGTPEKIKEINDLAALLDVEVGKVATSPNDPLITRRYMITRDTQETFDVIDRLLFEEGGGARTILGKETGSITVRGRKRDHEIVNEYLNELAKNAGGFKTVELINGDATDIAADTQVMLGITSENLADSVKLLPDDDRDFIMIKGTPIQVTEAVQIIMELDKKSAPSTVGLRTKRRTVKMSPSDRDRVLGSFMDVWPTMGRENPFEVRPPRSAAAKEDSLFRKQEKPEDWMDDQGSTLKQRFFEYAVLASPSLAMKLSQSFLQSPDELSPGDKLNPEAYQLPEQMKSVSGAPVRVWGTEFGIIIESDDLDAGDDAVYLVDQLLGEESKVVKPQVYQLKHIEATEMKSKLESYFGLASDSGGGGGGGGLLTGMADNLMGDAAGGVVDSLFGGDSGGSDSSSFEGDVEINADNRLNYLWVKGATSNDLVQIDAAIEISDVATAPHNPETAGQFFSIMIKHRDPEEIKNAVESFMEPYFKDAEGGQEGGGGGNDAANMVRALRQGIGGGNRGGGGGGSEAAEKKPRGYLSVDKKTSQLHFLGPESIFVQVEHYVRTVDLPEVGAPMKIVQLSVDDPEGTASALRDLLGGDHVEVVGGDAEGGESGTEGGDAMSNSGGSSADTQANRSAATRSSVLQMIRERATQAGRQGGGRQGGGRTGGGRTGGGRGGR